MNYRVVNEYTPKGMYLQGTQRSQVLVSEMRTTLVRL